MGLVRVNMEDVLRARKKYSPKTKQKCESKGKKMKTQNLLLKRITLSTAAIALALSSTACNKSSSTSSSVTSSFSMTASNKAATVAMKPSLLSLIMPKAMALMPSNMVDSTGLAINLSKSWVVIKEVEFKSEETASASESSEVEISFKGPYYVDLLSAAPQALDSQLVPAGSFRRIKMKLHKSEGAVPASVPSELSANSITIEGTIGTGGAAVNFAYLSDDGTEFQIGGPNAVTLDEGSKVLVEINFADIFKQINMSTVANNETISASNRHSGTHLCDTIDTSANDIYTCIRKGLEKYADAGKDSDGSGEIESDESDVK